MTELGNTLRTVNVSSSELSIILVRLMGLVGSNRPMEVSGHAKGTMALISLLSRMPVSTTEFFFGVHRPNSAVSFSLKLTMGRSSRGPICCYRCTGTEVYDVLHGVGRRNVRPHSYARRRLVLLGTPRRHRLVHRLSTLASRVVATTGSCSPTEVAHCTMALTALFRGFCGTYEINISSRGLHTTELCLYYEIGSIVNVVLARFGVAIPRDVWSGARGRGGTKGLDIRGLSLSNFLCMFSVPSRVGVHSLRTPVWRSTIFVYQMVFQRPSHLFFLGWCAFYTFSYPCQ